MKKVCIGRKQSTAISLTGRPRVGAPIIKNIINPEFESLSDEYKLKAKYMGAFQCDASDRREITLDNGDKVTTTLLKFGEFDVIAAGIFSFRNKWEFAFALNSDLPRSERYGDNSSHLIASLVNITYPLQKPFTDDPFIIFDKVIERRKLFLTIYKRYSLFSPCCFTEAIT